MRFKWGQFRKLREVTAPESPDCRGVMRGQPADTLPIEDATDADLTQELTKLGHALASDAERLAREYPPLGRSVGSSGAGSDGPAKQSRRNQRTAWWRYVAAVLCFVAAGVSARVMLLRDSVRPDGLESGGNAATSGRLATAVPQATVEPPRVDRFPTDKEWDDAATALRASTRAGGSEDVVGSQVNVQLPSEDQLELQDQPLPSDARRKLGGLRSSSDAEPLRLEKEYELLIGQLRAYENAIVTLQEEIKLRKQNEKQMSALIESLRRQVAELRTGQAPDAIAK